MKRGAICEQYLHDSDMRYFFSVLTGALNCMLLHVHYI